MLLIAGQSTTYRKCTVVLISASSSAIAQTALQGALGLAKSERLELGDNIFRTL